VRHASGHTVPIRLTVANMLDDRAVGAIVVTGVDIGQLVDARAELEHRATHDDLTGLANRTRLRSRLGQILTEPDATSHSLLFGDVDGLKAVNDRHGHQAGDAVLSTIAHRLRSVTRREDLVARVSGDEFVVIVASSDPDVVAGLQERITTAMLAPVTLPNGRLVTVSVSVGVVGIVEGVDIDELLAAADAAMYLAKRGVLTLPL
jgi:diguanylate cyclase (GGDEF)-like protein